MSSKDKESLKDAVYAELEQHRSQGDVSVDDVINATLKVAAETVQGTETEWWKDEPAGLKNYKAYLVGLLQPTFSSPSMDALARMLEDQAFLHSDELQESLEQMRRGEGEVVRANPYPKDEERP